MRVAGAVVGRLVGLLLPLSAPLVAGPCPQGPYSLYLAPNFTCTIGGTLTYVNFGGGNGTGNPSGIAIPADAIMVTPISTTNNEGFQFSANWKVVSQMGSSSFQDNLITFSAIGNIAGMRLTFDGTFSGSGIAGTNESYCINQTTGVVSCPKGNSGSLNVMSPGSSTSNIGFPAPIQSISIQTDINVTSGQNGTAGTSQVMDTFSIPPPGTVTITTTSPLPPGDVNSQYKGAPLTATGGTPPYHFVLTSGSFDPGLSFDATRTMIVGTPLVANTYNFALQAIDSANVASAAVPFTLTIHPALDIKNSSPLPNGTVGVAFTPLALTATGGDSAYTFASQGNPFNQFQNVPPGLNLTPGGVLSGTPTAEGVYNYIVILKDGTGSAFNKAFMQTINPPLTIPTASPLPSVLTGTPYSQKIDATGGMPPYVFSLQNAPAGMTIDPMTGVINWPNPTPVNTFTFQVTVTDSQQVVTQKTFQLTVTNGLLVSPLSLDFAAAVNGDSPVPQDIDISSLGAQPTSYGISIDGGLGVPAAPPWVTVKQLMGTTPARVVVYVDQSQMPAGKSTARIKVTDASQNTMIVLVTLTLTNVAPRLEVLPDEVDFQALTESPGDFERVIGVRNAGGGGPINFSAAIRGMSSWVTTVTPSSGQTVRNSLVFLRIRVSTQNVKIGSYREELAFTSNGGNPVVPIKLFVAGPGEILGTNVSGVFLEARRGGGFSNNPTIEVLNLGDPASLLDWTAEVLSGGDVVGLSTNSGTAGLGKPGKLTIVPKTGAFGMAAGGYYALIRISSARAKNSPAYVIVVFELDSEATPPLPDPFPAGLFFIATANGANPPSQSVAVNTSSAVPVTFQANAVTLDGNKWLGATPTTGMSTGSNPGQVTVTASISGLPAGVYFGEIEISIFGILRTVTVTLIVLPAGVAPPTGTAAAAPAAGCTPSKLVLTQTGLINNFAVPAKWPATLVTQLNDDCGALINGASVTANFSNGDAPLTLRGEGQNGTYSATWQPGTVSPQMTVTVEAEQGALQPATEQLIGSINANVAPVLFKNGTVNVFNRVPAGALAPSMIAEVYGSGLASPTATPGMLPLPITFNNTFVLVGPYQAPLYYLSDGQLDIQINAELAPNQQYPIVVSANGKLTLPQMIDVVPVQLGIAHYDDGHVIAQHGADSSYVTAASPAKPNEVLVMYLSGMGPTDPAVKSGDPAPASEPLARVTVTPTVMLDGQMAKLEFAGLTPGFVGLYQVNFDVPGNARTGDLDLVVIQNGVSSNTTKLPVAK